MNYQKTGNKETIHSMYKLHYSHYLVLLKKLALNSSDLSPNYLQLERIFTLMALDKNLKDFSEIGEKISIKNKMQYCKVEIVSVLLLMHYRHLNLGYYAKKKSDELNNKTNIDNWNKLIRILKQQSNQELNKNIEQIIFKLKGKEKIVLSDPWDIYYILMDSEKIVSLGERTYITKNEFAKRDLALLWDLHNHFFENRPNAKSNSYKTSDKICRMLFDCLEATGHFEGINITSNEEDYIRSIMNKKLK